MLAGGRTYIMPWIATARDLSNNAGIINSTAEEASRTATTCYMRGLKEKIQIQTNNGTAWQWRRICFTYKGLQLLTGTNGDGTRQAFRETSAGFGRVLSDWNNANAVVNPLLVALFKGQQGIDWRSYFTAPLDTRRVTVKYDKTRIITSGNASGVMRNFTMWFPMNKNIVYDDDEAGPDETTQNLSVSSKQGMGDYYVVDIIAGGTGSGTSDALTFDPEASLYWHEK